MKRILIIIIIISLMSLSACNINILKEEKAEGNNKQEETQLNTDNNDASNKKDANYLSTIEKPESLDGLDILQVANAFVLDLLTEDFQRLESLYPYNEEVDTLIKLDEVQKEIIFHNVDMGEVHKLNETYIYQYGTNKFVIVPIEASLHNLNVQVSFNKNNQIIGFSYEEFGLSSATQTRERPEGIVEEDYSFYSDGHVITGTFTSPTSSGDGTNLATYPLVVLTPGFGPSDRDLSIFENKPFRDLAWGLAEAGIATYRYDKRTYLYDDVVNAADFTVYDESINDAIVAVNMAKELGNVNQNRVYVLGFSQGGYLLPRTAEGLIDIAGYIFVSSPAQHMKNYIKEQYEYLAMEDGKISLEEHTTINKMIEDISKLEMLHQIPAQERVQGFYKNYWLDLSTYNPIQTASKITSPVLVLQGERDYQVTTKQYNLWMSAFVEAQNWTFKSYPDLNHFMMKGEGNSYSSEYRIKNHVDLQVIQDIANFIFTN
ncbi:MAG: prolyl oligopeptidase family serine peptidase [Clostridiales bacterium]|nr:prolyl oligopeptidase family serine peptidase [Clostridiales bacterium]